MEGLDAIRIHDYGAAAYDESMAAYGSYVHEVLFGLCFEHVSAGERLLDLGTGTGLAALPFARLGLRITGVDGSAEMLKVCGDKGFGAELLHWDLVDLPLPYRSGAFRHVIACGLFHFLEDVEPLVAETARLLDGAGIFAFTVATPESGANGAGAVLAKVDAGSGVRIYAHGAALVARLLQACGFAPLKIQYFYAHAFRAEEPPLLMAAYVTQKLDASE